MAMGKTPQGKPDGDEENTEKKCSASLLGTLVRKVTSLPVPFRLQSRLRGRRSFLRAKLPTSVTRGWHLIPETSPNTFTNILAPNEIIIIVSWESAPWKTPFSPPCHHRLAQTVRFRFDSIVESYFPSFFPFFSIFTRENPREKYTSSERVPQSEARHNEIRPFFSVPTLFSTTP